MAQFDVCVNANSETSDVFPYLLELQTELLSQISTVVVAPLVRLAALKKPARHLNPVFEVDGSDVVMMTEQIAGIPKSTLGAPVTSLAPNRAEILAALDFLFTGS